MRHVKRLLPILLAFCIVLCGCRANSPNAQTDSAPAEPGSLVFYYTNETHTSLISPNSRLGSCGTAWTMTPQGSLGQTAPMARGSFTG